MTRTLSAKPGRRVKWTAAEQAEWLCLFERSGQSALQFGRENGLSTSTLTYWLRQQKKRAPSHEETLVELPREVLSSTAAVLSPSASASGITMQFPSGLRLHIVTGTDPAWLAQVLRALPAGGL